MPEHFEVFVYPDYTFKVNSDPDQYKKDLIKEFPHEIAAIQAYFKDIELIGNDFGFSMASQHFPNWLKSPINTFRSIFQPKFFHSTKEYFDKQFQDEKLRALLLSQWGDYGLPPSESILGMHCIVAKHYLKGGYFPIGGSKQIAAFAKEELEQRGTLCHTYHKVKSIIMENGVAVGVDVEVKKGQNIENVQFYSDYIISDTGARSTFFELLPPDVELPFREKLKDMPCGPSCVTLFLGLKDDPKKMGFQGENYWMYPSFDHDSAHKNEELLYEGKAQAAYLSFPSLKNPEAQHPTAEVIAFCHYDRFKQWADQTCKRRDEDYKALKEQIAKGLIEFVNSKFPGFEEMIDFYELSTPLTIEHYTLKSKGEMYGLPATKERYQAEWLTAKTVVPNLYLTGCDIASVGVMGAAMGGFITAACIRGIFSVPKMMNSVMTWMNKH